VLALAEHSQQVVPALKLALAEHWQEVVRLSVVALVQHSQQVAPASELAPVGHLQFRSSVGCQIDSPRGIHIDSLLKVNETMVPGMDSGEPPTEPLLTRRLDLSQGAS